MLRSLPVMLSFNVGMILSDFFVFVFLFAWWETGRDISVIGGQLCARTLGWKRPVLRTVVYYGTTLASYVD